MSDAVEAKLTSWSAKANREVRLGFVIQADDHDKVLHLSKMVGHDFGLALAKIDQQPAKENVEIAPAPEPNPSARPNLYAKRAGILCNDPRFQGFLFDRYGGGKSPTDPVERRTVAAKMVRALCDVDSRSQIIAGTPAADRFDILESAYLAECSI